MNKRKSEIGTGAMGIIILVVVALVLILAFGPKAMQASDTAIDLTKWKEQDSIALRWSKIMRDYDAHKCTVDKSTCQINNKELPCLCFDSERQKNKQRPQECTEGQFCYDGNYGCSSEPPPASLHWCKESLKNEYIEPPKCTPQSVDKFTCKIINKPCACTKDNALTGVGKEKTQTLCVPGEYCFESTAGCLDADSQSASGYFEYCLKFTGAKVEEMQDCEIDENCRIKSDPCKCKGRGGTYSQCSESSGLPYCYSGFGCSVSKISGRTCSEFESQ